MSEQVQQITGERLEVARERLKSPRAAAIAGILFAVLFASSMILIRLSIPENMGDLTDSAWLEGDVSRPALAFSLVPIAGIAFLWFMGVVRDRVGRLEDQLFSTVFFGSGLLFLAMMFAASAVAGGLLSFYAVARSPIEDDVSIFGTMVVYTIMRVYGIRMAGVFMISLGTIAIRTGIMPRLLALLTYGLALVLLVTVNATPLLILIFPGWVFVISIYILFINLRGGKASTEEALGAIQT
jgi:hypothetical protein